MQKEEKLSMLCALAAPFLYSSRKLIKLHQTKSSKHAFQRL